MKKLITILILACISPVLLSAQKRDYRVVFDMTSNDSVNQKNVIRWIDEITTEEPDAKIEVVFYSQSVPMVIKEKSMRSDDILRVTANKNVSFRVCAIALKNQHYEPGQLIAGVQTVPDGIYEIISKQRQGWGYIKVAH
jgi:uncharacterized protein